MTRRVCMPDLGPLPWTGPPPAGLEAFAQVLRTAYAVDAPGLPPPTGGDLEHARRFRAFLAGAGVPGPKAAR